MTVLSESDIEFLEQQVSAYEAEHGSIATAEHEISVANESCSDCSGTCKGTTSCICGGSCSGTCYGSTK